MAQSLLGTSSSVSRAGTGGGLGNKKFKSLPKIPKAKFEMTKFETAEFKPFEGERQELERRSVTDHVLNWAPEAVSYAPHCLARESREMITGQNANEIIMIGFCWSFKFLKESDVGVAGVFKGFSQLCLNTELQVHEGDHYLSVEERQKDLRGRLGTKEHLQLLESLYDRICAAIPGALTLAGAIAAYAGVKSDSLPFRSSGYFVENKSVQTGSAHRKVAQLFMNRATSRQRPIGVEGDKQDAVKRGDAQILSSIGTLNRNILSEMKGFFDHYVSEIFTRLTHIEDKSSHESSQLKQALDTYAKAEIGAVNSNGKQIISAMNKQHTAMNKNLGTAAKQIFDLTHEEHKVLAEKIDGVNTNIAATSDAIDNLEQSTQRRFSDAFDEFADALTESNLLDVDLHRSARSAIDHFDKWHQDSMHRVGRGNLQQIEQAMRALHGRMESTHKQALAGNQTLVQKREVFASLQKDANSTLHQLFQMQGASDESAPAVVDQEIKKLLKAAHTSIRSHHLTAERMGRRMQTMQRSDYNHSSSPARLATDLHIEAQLVEFDKIMPFQERVHPNLKLDCLEEIPDEAGYKTKCSCSDTVHVLLYSSSNLGFGAKLSVPAARLNVMAARIIVFIEAAWGLSLPTLLCLSTSVLLGLAVEDTQLMAAAWARDWDVQWELRSLARHWEQPLLSVRTWLWRIYIDFRALCLEAYRTSTASWVLVKGAAHLLQTGSLILFLLLGPGTSPVIIEATTTLPKEAFA
ncbi:cugbp1-b [Symbiodinium sp. CCMP2456]|nr:cugbp1-b [Symbiodinium sp. CCMP2456]